MAHYFLISEQIKSVVALGVKLSEDGNIKDVYITRGDIKYTDIPREERR